MLPSPMAALDDHLGGPWEAAVRDHIRAECAAGRLVPDAVAVGPWWSDNGQHGIDALVLAGRRRVPALAVEAKWAERVGGGRPHRSLLPKAAAVADSAESLRYAVAARARVDRAADDLITITARDVLPT